MAYISHGLYQSWPTPEDPHLTAFVAADGHPLQLLDKRTLRLARRRTAGLSVDPFGALYRHRRRHVHSARMRSF